MPNQSNDSSETLGPLKTQSSAEELNNDICLRLRLRLNACSAEATPEGWRKLAMYLISRLPEFKFESEPGDDSKLHLPLMRIECLIRTNYPVIEKALDEARWLNLPTTWTDTWVNMWLAIAPKLSIAEAVRIELGLGEDEKNWTDEETLQYQNLIREYRRTKDKDALFTSSIRRGAHKSLRAWIAIENAFVQLENQDKLKHGAVNEGDLEPNG
jgi:hypothetical protein